MIKLCASLFAVLCVALTVDLCILEYHDLEPVVLLSSILRAYLYKTIVTFWASFPITSGDN
jgi:hypothetical protein